MKNKHPFVIGLNGLNAKLRTGHRSHISGTARSQRYVREKMDVLQKQCRDLIREFNGHKKKSAADKDKPLNGKA